jgi:phospholipase C
MKLSKKLVALMSATALTLNAGSYAFANGAPGKALPQSNPNATTSTPIKHLVVIFQENVSFDHYFGTYPTATNPKGEPKFTAQAGTPSVNNLVSANLLTNNPNFTNSANGAGAANPFRLDRTQAASADQNHNYTPEQQAEDNGAMDLFPKYTGTASAGGIGAFGTTGQVMGYYDGNTVTGLWNYAQRFAMDDNARTDGFGPSTPGALEVVSGQLNGLEIVKGSGLNSYYVADGQNGYTDIGDVDPAGDVCSSTSSTIQMNGLNIGDLLDAQGGLCTITSASTRFAHKPTVMHKNSSVVTFPPTAR